MHDTIITSPRLKKTQVNSTPLLHAVLVPATQPSFHWRAGMFLKISAKQEKEERHVLSENQKDVQNFKNKIFLCVNSNLAKASINKHMQQS